MMSQGRRIVILTLATFALAACGNKEEDRGGPARWDNFPVAIYTDPGVVPNAQAHDDFQKAMEFWESKVGKRLFDYRGNWNGQGYGGGDSIAENSMYVKSPWNYAMTIAAQTLVLSRKSQILGAVIMINPHIGFCQGECQGQYSGTSARKVFAHELGHFLGLTHSGDADNIMYPDALPGGSISSLKINSGELASLVN